MGLYHNGAKAKGSELLEQRTHKRRGESTGRRCRLQGRCENESELPSEEERLHTGDPAPLYRYLSFIAQTETKRNQKNMLLTNTKDPDRILWKDMVAKHYKSTEHNWS